MFRQVSCILFLHRSNRGTELGLQFSQSLLINVSSFFRISQVSLSLSKFSQIQGSNFFGFFDLLLVALDLALKSINQSLHTFMVLTILISSECQLLDTPFRASEILLSIGKTSTLSIHLGLELTNASFHLIHRLLSSLKSILFCIIQASLTILCLAFEQLTVFLEGLGQFLFLAQFIGETSCINHSLLGLILRETKFTAHLIHISVDGLQLGFKFPLCTSNCLVLAGELGQGLVCVG